MSENDRAYSDREFALILAKASELARSTGGADPTSAGLSLTEMKRIAAEVGLDPALVERAARLTPLDAPESRWEDVIGGRVKHRLRGHLATPLTEERAARLLNAVKAAAEQHGEGESSASGVTWRSVGEGSPILFSANAEGGGTDLRVVHDRRAGLAATAGLSGIGSLAAAVLVLLVGEASGLQSLPIGLSLIGGAVASVLAVGRAAWASASRRSQARVAALMDAASRSLEESTPDPASDAGDAPEVRT